MYPVTNGICSFSSTEVGDVRKHYLHKHKSREDMKIHRELVPNKKYIPPGEHKCPKRARCLNVAGRNEAAADRQTIVPVIEMKSDPIVCRDESLTLTKRTINGSTEYKAHTHVKKHWMPFSKKK